MPLSLKQLEDVCLLFSNSSKRCRYLMQEDDPTVWFCLKKTSKKSEIDEEADDYIRDLKKKGTNPNSQPQPAPLGNNCPGYPILRYVSQGYDQP